jgi:hypothetical protein
MSKFDEIAPRLMADLQAQIPEWGAEDAAACVGNLAHESAGFATMQEIHPVVSGSKGGLGYGQWTGPRRRSFEAYCTAQKLAFDDYEANLGYLLLELRGTEASAVRATADADTLDDKVVAFEAHFERAGTKHYDSRKRWAHRAMGNENLNVAEDPTQTVTLGAQMKLRQLGYFEVGKADGLPGTRTTAAIVAFQLTEGLDATGELDDKTLRRLDTAGPRPVSEDRKNTTISQLREAGSRTIAKTDGVKNVAGLQAVAGGVVATASGVTSYFGDAWEKVAIIKTVFAQVPTWCWGILAIAIAFGLYWQAHQTQLARLDDEQTGKNAGVA